MKFILSIFLFFASGFLLANELNLTEHKGKVIYLDFWASWCDPCKESFPWLNKIKVAYPDLKVIAINLDKEKKSADDFLKKYPADFEIIFSPSGKLAEKYKVKGMPYSIIFDRKGKQRFSHIGYSKKKSKDYLNEIKRLLSEKI